MKDLKANIAKESLEMIANHYSTTTQKVSLAISNGNTKLYNELTRLCETSLELILKEVA